MERKNAITMKGNPLTLVGAEIAVGQKAPDFAALANDMSEVKLSDYRGKTVVLSAVPSLDTAVCAKETRRFNEEAARMGKDVVILTLSMDLPFAQQRWAQAAKIENLTTLSDHRDADFGQKYGLLIKELRLLARAVLVIDKEGVVRYVQLVPEVSDEPDYEAVFEAIRKASAESQRLSV